MIKLLTNVADDSNQLPSSLELHGVNCNYNGQPVEQGGFGDVYKGTYNGKPIAVKVIRPESLNDVPVMRKVRLTQIESSRSKMSILSHFHSSNNRGIIWKFSLAPTQASKRHSALGHRSETRSFNYHSLAREGYPESLRQKSRQNQ